MDRKKDDTRVSVPPDLFLRLRRAREYMDDCYASAIDLDHLSRLACVSPFHFLRMFRRAFGITPHRYLMRRRIERARELLSFSNASVTDVCFDVGFESHGSFSTLFRKITGDSPIAYRTRVVVTRPIWIPSCYIRSYGISLLPPEK
jgi:transcriptional regulator GlxA family with amidase domain